MPPTTTLSKVPSRGGIRKARSSGPRVDRHGDVIMDEGSSAPSTREGSTTRGGRGGRGAIQPGPRHLATSRAATQARATALTNHLEDRIRRGDAGKMVNVRDSNSMDTRIPISDYDEFEVSGLARSKVANNKTGGIPELVSFLERKAGAKGDKGGVKIFKTRRHGDNVILIVHPDHRHRISGLDGFNFASSKLSIKLSKEGKGGSAKGGAGEIRDALKAIIAKRYNPEAKFFDLGSFMTDAPELFKDGRPESAGDFFDALMAVCTETVWRTPIERKENVVSISLANNNINDASGVMRLAKTFPDLQNLDLSHNSIANLAALSALQGKFPFLNEILIENNPIITNEPNLAQTLFTEFPTLRMINGQEVRSAHEAAVATVATKVNLAQLSRPPIRGQLHDPSGLGLQFLESFYTNWDSNRQECIRLFYDNQSQFSLNVNTINPRGRDPNEPRLEVYISLSRNLAKVHHPAARNDRLHKGESAIATLWTKLPASRHSDIRTNPNKWCIEGNTIPCVPDPSGQAPQGTPGLIVTVHSEFAEQDTSSPPKTIMRSFSRTFVLGPSTKPGGAPVRVVNDMLSVRAYTPSEEAFTFLDEIANAAVNNSAAGPAGDAARQESLIAELSAATRMKPEYSRMCLEQVAWEMNAAKAMFEEKKAVLPPDAFQ